MKVEGINLLILSNLNYFKINKMNTLEQEIETLKKKHAQLELDAYNQKLKEKFEELKKLEGTVEVRVYKTSKTTRSVHIVHHISYEILTDSWKRDNEPEHNYIGQKLRTIQIMEAPRTPYKQYAVECRETTPNGYDGKIHAKPESYSYDFSTHKTLSVDEFNTIWEICKTTTNNILDGILDIKDIPWLMTGTDEDFEFKTNKTNEYQLFALDIPNVLLTQEESWKLNSRFTKIFLNKNIYIITPNSLLALDAWIDYEIKSDSWSSQACASVGERWRGSRVDEYRALVEKIKSHKTNTK
jgi:hypothetical protein